jgi:GNAT superfamily N-acetyltransferase
VPPSIEIRRINDLIEAERCEPLFREFIELAASGMAATHGVVIGDDGIEALHAGLRREWPELVAGRGRMVLALVDGREAGVSILKPTSEREAELKRMYVREEHRGLGLARLMLERVVADACEEGFAGILLETFDYMAEAQALYRSVGFVEIERFDGHEGHAHGVAPHEVFMRLDLEA